MLDVPHELVSYVVAGLLRAERRVRGTRRKSRSLTCYRQALFALVWFRDRGVDLRQLGAGFGISRATAYRYRDEAVSMLTAQAPDLTQALRQVKPDGWTFVILDGKIVDADRCRAKTTSRTGEQIDLWYSDKKHDFGGNVRAVMRPDGFPIWVGDVEPGSVHDLVCAQEHAPRSALRRSRPRASDAGRPGLRRRGPRRAHAVQAAHRRPPSGHRQPHLQHAAALATRNR